MGTFHHDKHELHGITVVVDTNGPKVYVGRCDNMDAQVILLNDVDEHEDGKDGKSKQQYLERAAKFGTWKKHDRLAVPQSEVASVFRLAEVLTGVPALVSTAPVAVEVSEEQAASEAKNSDGPKRTVELSSAAQVEVQRLIVEMDKPGIGLRLGIKGGGCSGLSYLLDFDLKKEGDMVLTYDNFEVFLDKKSTIYLRGVELDHQKGLAGKGFVFKNPNATNTCGCGESFSV